MICDLPKFWSFIIYNGFKSHVNVTDALNFFAGYIIKVGKKEAGTGTFNQAYDTFWENQDKAQTRQLLELALKKIRGRIKQWQLIIIISTSIQNIPAKFWTDSFVTFNLHPHRRLYFSVWIKKIASAVRTGETAYFRKHEGFYYYAMPYVWKKMTLIKRREVIYVIYCFTAETPYGKYLWTKLIVLSIIGFVQIVNLDVVSTPWEELG